MSAMRRPDWANRTMLRRAALIAAALGLAAVATVMLTYTLYMYRGTAEPALATQAQLACRAPDGSAVTPCAAKLQALGNGTFRAYLLEPKGQSLVVRLILAAGETRPPAALLLRAGHERFGRPWAQIAVAIDGAAPTTLDKPTPPHWRRIVRDLPTALPRRSVEIVVRPALPADADKALILDEVGLFASRAAINHVTFFGPQSYESYYPLFLFFHRLAWIVLGLMALAVVSRERGARWTVAAGAALATLIGSHIAFHYTNGPEWAAPARLMQTAGTVLEGAGANLNYVQYMAMGLAEGKGPIIVSHPPWNRMPGIGFLYLPAVVKGDLIATSVNVLFWQLAILAAGTFALTAALARIAPLWVAGGIGFLIAMLPKTPYYSQMESMIVGIACLLLAAACLFIADTEERRQVRLSRHVLLHLAFALWLSLRVDVLPLWAITSLLLYGWPPARWRYLALPASLVLLICVPWGLFKLRFAPELSMTTNSFGASLMVGNWEVPHPFVWKVEDGTYFAFAKDIPGGAATKAASDYAVREVLRFWLTFPLYLVSLVWHEMLNAVQGQINSGTQIKTWLTLSGRTIFAAAAVLLAALLVRYKPHRLLLLGGILAFNLPIFFLVYSGGGRFYNVAQPVIVLLPLLILADRDFWTRVRDRPWALVLALLVPGLIGLYGRNLDRWMIQHDGFRFAAPFADPARSPLVVWRNPPLAWAKDRRQIDLAGVSPAPGVRLTKGESVRLEADEGPPRPIATLALPAEVATAARCRLHVDLGVVRSAVTVAVERTGAAGPAPPDPIAGTRASWTGRGDAILELDVAVAPLPPGAGPPRLVVRTLKPGAPAVSIKTVILYGCSKS